MYIASEKYKVKFTGVAITGWSRYDHMLSLSEFLPSSIPSLVYALQTIVYGRITNELNETISRLVLGCLQMPLWERSSFPTYVSCAFPGYFIVFLFINYN
jgi:hexosaminidase